MPRCRAASKGEEAFKRCRVQPFDGFLDAAIPGSRVAGEHGLSVPGCKEYQPRRVRSTNRLWGARRSETRGDCCGPADLGAGSWGFCRSRRYPAIDVRFGHRPDMHQSDP